MATWTTHDIFMSLQLILRPRPHYTLDEFENGALFLRLGLPFRLIRRNCPPKTELFQNALENEAFRFSVDEKHFENGVFRKRWRHDNQVICLPESSSKHKSKMAAEMVMPCWFGHVGSIKTLLCACSRVHSSVSGTCDCCVLTFLRRRVDGKHFIRFLVWTKDIWCVFRVKPPFSNSSCVVWTGLCGNSYSH